MKKIIALVVSIVMICCLSVTAFAAESPTATEKVTLTVRKAEVVDPAGKVDVEYTFDKGTTLTVKADEAKYGTFKDWSVYKVVAAVEGVSAPVSNGVVTLSAVKNLAATTKTEKAVEGTDYEIVKGSLTSKEMTIKLNTAVIVCGNYGDKVTDPNASSNADGSASAPQTGDMTVVYAVIVMLGVVAFGFGAKKAYSK